MAAIVPFPTSPRARRHKARLRRTAQPAPGPFTMPGPATPPPGHWHPSLGGGLPDGVA